MSVPAQTYDGLVAPVSAHDIARELRRSLSDAGVVKIHKLLYFAQGLHLGLTGEPLFTEAVEAWVNGPVVADLWHDEDKHRPVPVPRHLDAGMLAILDEVIERYGSLTGRELVHRTHSDGGPWCQVTETDEDAWIQASGVIPSNLMRDWFEKDDAVAGHLSAAARIRAHQRDLLEADAASSGLLEALERVFAGEVVCEGRPA